MDGYLGPDAWLTLQKEDCSVYQLENETGNGLLTVYDVFPGVTLLYNDLHLRKITGHEGAEMPPGLDVLSINHCREGRFECELKNGECRYLGEGDLALSSIPTPLKSSSFPLAHYHGISIQINIPLATQTLDNICKLLHIKPIDLLDIKARLLADRPYFLVRDTETVAHIFTELYGAPPVLKESYIRLKIIELLLFLSIAEPEGKENRRYIYRTQVDTVKALRDHIVANLSQQFTDESECRQNHRSYLRIPCRGNRRPIDEKSTAVGQTGR